MTTSSKVSIKTNAATDEDNGRNESWHWTNDEIGIAVVDSECESWSDSSVGWSVWTIFSGCRFKSHSGQLFIGTSYFKELLRILPHDKDKIKAMTVGN